MTKDFQRMIDEAHKPTEEEILDFVGEKVNTVWLELKQFIEDSYKIEPEILFWGKKASWVVG